MNALKNDIIYWIWYSNISGISSSVKIKLLENVESPKEIFKTAGKCLAKNNVSKTIIDKIAAFATVGIIERYIPILEENEDLGIVTYFDYDYPQLLCGINNPPLVIYYKGEISLLRNRCIAVIGTRDATDKGKYHARSFAREIAAQGYTVVGGLSAGIETAAHIGAMSTGATCAVLASGIDTVYPKENKELYNKICENGVVISEYMPGTKTGKYAIPFRNRIISGLCESVLLIEAPEKSGSLTTVNHALEQGRDVYVLDDRSSASEFSGNRMLINEGATAVTNPYDILSRHEYTAYDSLDRTFAMSAAEPIEYAQDERKSVPKEYSDLSEDEKEILGLIRSGIKQFDEIVMNSELDVSSVGYALTMLEFKGIITQKFGKVYEENQ